MDSREDHAPCQATIDRLARELADSEREKRLLAERIKRLEARCRAWRRVAEWQHRAQHDN